MQLQDLVHSDFLIVYRLRLKEEEGEKKTFRCGIKMTEILYESVLYRL